MFPSGGKQDAWETEALHKQMQEGSCWESAGSPALMADLKMQLEDYEDALKGHRVRLARLPSLESHKQGNRLMIQTSFPHRNGGFAAYWYFKDKYIKSCDMLVFYGNRDDLCSRTDEHIPQTGAFCHIYNI